MQYLFEIDNCMTDTKKGYSFTLRDESWIDIDLVKKKKKTADNHTKFKWWEKYRIVFFYFHNLLLAGFPICNK